MTIETKLETIGQLAIGMRVSFPAVRNNIGIVLRLSEPSLVPIISDNRRSTVYTFQPLSVSNFPWKIMPYVKLFETSLIVLLFSYD